MKKVAIIGGGACGLALAAALKNSFKVEIFEKSEYSSFIVGEHVPYQLSSVFDDLNIPSKIIDDNALPCLNITGNWAGKAVEQEGMFHVGYDKIINRPSFDQDLAIWLQSQKVQIHTNTPVLDISQTMVTTRESVFENYDWVINCSGRNSNKADTHRLVFDQLIGVCYYEPKEPTMSSHVIIESEASGWWYFSHNRNYYVSTFFTDSDILDKEQIDGHYQEKFLAIHGKPSLHYTKLTRPAFTSILERIPEKFYGLGDAFMSFDPLSAQGIYKAFKDAYEFAHHLSENKVSEFYKKKQSDFLDYMKQRTEFYKAGYHHYQSEFYKRRVS